jgi:hypothetical protein
MENGSVFYCCMCWTMENKNLERPKPSHVQRIETKMLQLLCSGKDNSETEKQAIYFWIWLSKSWTPSCWQSSFGHQAPLLTFSLQMSHSNSGRSPVACLRLSTWPGPLGGRILLILGLQNNIQPEVGLLLWLLSLNLKEKKEEGKWLTSWLLLKPY